MQQYATIQDTRKILHQHRLVICLFYMMLISIATSGTAHADNWVDLSGTERLRELVSGVTAEIEVRPGVIVTAEYFEDGTATIKAWDETFARTWEVRGDHVCFSKLRETKCFTLEQNQDVPGEYRMRHTTTGEIRVFRISGTDPRVVTSETQPSGEGDLVSLSAEEIAVKLSDPNSTTGSLSTFFDYVTFDGDLPDADSQRSFSASFQPSLPYPLSETMNLFVRPAIPVIINKDVPSQGGGFESKGINLGDISYDIFIGKSFASGFILGGGLVGTIPTATNDALGADQWHLGPELLLAKKLDWGVLGILATHKWDVAGEDDYSTSVTGGQLLYKYNLGGGWFFNGNPTFSYNHNASSDDALTLPLAFGGSRTVIIAGRPWTFSAQYWYYIVSPDTFGPKHKIRIGISPVIDLPW